MEESIPTYFIVIDNLRYDQWKIIEPNILQDFDLVNDEIYYSILPTATQYYSRNAIFLVCYHLRLREDFLINGRMMKMKEVKICLRKISLLISLKVREKRFKTLIHKDNKY